MDVSGLVLTSLGICFEVASTLYSYGKQVKGARRDIQNLSNELFGLIGVLEHLKTQQQQHTSHNVISFQPPPYTEIAKADQKVDKREQQDSLKESRGANDAIVLKQTVEFLQEFQKGLKVPSSRLGLAIQLLKWPLRESEVQEHLMRLERVKTYFVLSLVTDEVEQSRNTALEISSLRTLVEDVSLRQQVAESRNEHQGMMQWLCPVDPNIIRNSTGKSRMPGTGTWFTESEELQLQSKSDESSCFWLNGITGAGKTTLLTATIDELLINHKDQYNLAYFYCSFSIAESLHTHNILGSILAQTCIESDPVYLHLKSRYTDLSMKSLTKPTKLDDDVLINLIAQQAKCREHLFIIVDGINESNDPYSLLKAFETILKSATGVQLLISSINERKIQQSISRMPKIYELTASPRKVKSDVSILVSSALTTNSRLKELPQALKGEIARRLTHGAEGIATTNTESKRFRWVQCQLDLLAKLRTPGAVKNALDSLPLTLDKTYEDLLERIDGEEDRLLTKQILQILTFALRPLSLEEVSTMLQVTPGMRNLDRSKCLTHPTDILDICGSLLKYNEKTGMVTLAHHSVKTYLTSTPRQNTSYFRLEKDEAHRSLALTCIAYLSFDVFAEDCKSEGRAMLNKHPALRYATESWGLHMKEVSDPGELLLSNLRYFLLSADDGRDNFINWVQILIPGSLFARTTPPLYYAASYGLTDMVKYLLDMGVDVEVHGGRGGATPINIAAFRGNLDVVKMLHDHGADPLDRDLSTNLNAIQWAGYERKWHVVEYFKEKGYLPGSPIRSPGFGI